MTWHFLSSNPKEETRGWKRKKKTMKIPHVSWKFRIERLAEKERELRRRKEIPNLSPADIRTPRVRPEHIAMKRCEGTLKDKRSWERRKGRRLKRIKTFHSHIYKAVVIDRSSFGDTSDMLPIPRNSAYLPFGSGLSNSPPTNLERREGEECTHARLSTSCKEKMKRKEMDGELGKSLVKCQSFRYKHPSASASSWEEKSLPLSSSTRIRASQSEKKSLRFMSTRSKSLPHCFLRHGQVSKCV